MINFKKYNEPQQLNTNYLDYVGVAFMFSTISDFDSFENVFFAKIKKILPYRKEFPIKEVQLQITQKNSFQTAQKDLMQYIYEDNQENPTVRLVAVNNSLDFQCPPLRENYKGFDYFLNNIIELVYEFFNVYNDKVNLNSLVLRKINKFSYLNCKKDIGSNLLCEKELFSDLITQSFKEILCFYDNKIIEIRNGILPNGTTNDKDIIFDYLIKINNSNLLENDTSKIKKQLKELNLLAFNIFSQTIGDEFFKSLLQEGE